MHYAVETTLGYDAAFWGLIARGWGLDRFSEKDAATGRLAHTLPEMALVSENLVGILQLAQTGSVSADPDELFPLLSLQLGVVPAEITPDSIAAIRARFADLQQRWQGLPPGGTLELTFPVSDASRGGA
jgi:hypothetical protein